MRESLTSGKLSYSLECTVDWNGMADRNWSKQCFKAVFRIVCTVQHGGALVAYTPLPNVKVRNKINMVTQ